MARRVAPPNKATQAFTLSVTNLKFIGAAFDVAIADLEMIKENVTDRAPVEAKIAALRELKGRTEDECPQSWYVPFVI